MAEKLTKATIKSWLARCAAEPSSQQRFLWDASITGLAVRLTPKGAASWIVNYRLADRPETKRHTLGGVELLSVDEARDEARALLLAARHGRDLVAERKAKASADMQAAKRAAQRIRTPDAVSIYLEHFETSTVRHGAAPALGTIKKERGGLLRLQRLEKILEEVTQADLLAVINDTPPASRSQSHRCLKRFFAWAMEAKHIVSDPTEKMKAPRAPDPRERTPSVADIKTLLAGMKDAVGAGPLAGDDVNAIRLIVLTAARRDEVVRADWSEFNLGDASWTIPAERSKTRKEYQAVLGPRACDHLKEMWEAAGRPMSGPVFYGRERGENDERLSQVMKRVTTRLGLDFSLHDVRRSLVSALAEAGVSLETCDAVLNHARSATVRGVTRHYMTSRLTGARREALELWEDVLLGGSNVVPMRRNHVA